MATPTLNPTPLDASAAPPATDRKTRRPLKYTLIIGSIGVLLSLTFLKYRAVFSLPSNPLFFANNYLVWRMLSDREIFSEPYKAVSDNAYDSANPDWAAFIELAQKNEKLLMTGHPEHFPRGQNKHYTLFTSPVQAVAAVFKDFCQNETKKLPMYDDFMAGKKSIQKKQYVSLNADDFDRAEVVNIFSRHEKASRILIATHQMLQYFISIQSDSDRITSQVPDSITDLALNIAAQCDISVERAWLEQQILSAPQALSHLFFNFAISRGLVLCYLASFGAKLDLFSGMEEKLNTLAKDSKDAKDLEKEIDSLKGDPNQRAKTVWMGIHRIITNAFIGQPIGFDSNLGFFDRNVNKVFGFKKITDEQLASTEENGQAVLDEMQAVVQELITKNPGLKNAEIESVSSSNQ